MLNVSEFCHFIRENHSKRTALQYGGTRRGFVDESSMCALELSSGNRQVSLQ